MVRLSAWCLLVGVSPSARPISRVCGSALAPHGRPGQRADRRVVRVDLHEVRHGVPPLPHDLGTRGARRWCPARPPAGRRRARAFRGREISCSRARHERRARVAARARSRRDDASVLGFVAGLEEHGESDSFHTIRPTPCRGSRGPAARSAPRPASSLRRPARPAVCRTRSRPRRTASSSPLPGARAGRRASTPVLGLSHPLDRFEQREERPSARHAFRSPTLRSG